MKEFKMKAWHCWVMAALALAYVFVVYPVNAKEGPTRAEFVTEMLTRVSAETGVDLNAVFPVVREDIALDVALDLPEHVGVAWCYQRGFLVGDGKGYLRPDDVVTAAETEIMTATFDTMMSRARYVAGLPDRVGRWVEVDLANYRVYLWEDGSVLQSFLVAIGRDATPTYTGEFSIYKKLELRTMRGKNLDGSTYVQPDVPWCAYFNGGIAFHGCYWHSNWGTKVSHGCVNMRNEDAKDLFKFVGVGTYVLVH